MRKPKFLQPAAFSALLLLPALLLAGQPVPVGAMEAIEPDWDDPALRRAMKNLPGSRDGGVSVKGGPDSPKLPILGLPIKPDTPTAQERGLEVRSGTRDSDAPKLKLPDCADKSPAIAMVTSGEAATWYTRNYDFGCLHVSIAGTAENSPLDPSDQLVQAALADSRSDGDEIEWNAIDEGPPEQPALGTFEGTLTVAKIPYSVTLECFDKAEEFCADQAQRDALVDQLILIGNQQPVTAPEESARGEPEPELEAAPDTEEDLPGPVAAAERSPAAARGDVDFRYHAPGALFPGSGKGFTGRKVYFPDIAFPLKVGKGAGPNGEFALAYANSQILPKSGAITFSFPWRDNYCETRKWKMSLCPSGKGHQGQDIRPSSRKNKYWLAVAMDDGKVTKITKNTTVTIRADSGYTCRYLHLDFASISKLKVGQRVKKGSTIVGKVSNIMGGIPNE